LLSLFVKQNKISSSLPAVELDQICRHSYLREAMHKNQVRRPRLSLNWTCCEEQSPGWASPYYWHWSIQRLSQNSTFL